MSPDVIEAKGVPSDAVVPLVVDVDGTLIATDLLHESALHYVASTPWRALDILVWLRRGRAHLKSRLADAVPLTVDTLPLRHEVVTCIRAAQADGRPVYLASASDRRYVQALADRIGGIDGVFATDAEVNLAGQAKTERLVDAFGVGGYDYIGNGSADWPVWDAARRQLAVAGSRAFARGVTGRFADAEIVAHSRARASRYVAALRPHQWAKNVLLFLPAFASHRLELPVLMATALGFICFSLAASSAYVLNDLLDLPADRAHPRKSRRPFAAGEIPVAHGVGMSVIGVVLAFALATMLPPEFALVLLTYFGGTLAYSLVLKRRALIDVVTLGGLYTVRVYGGLAAADIPWSEWLLMFGLFFFLSLAIVKRCSELLVRRQAGFASMAGRDYRAEDLQVLLALGAAAGYGSVL
ncbi:MAG: UbiA family prenyltransferase, partial [Acetobacteraceae bacterium]|nr:UbiA family prenyltransferase [Acetobacteraceae bacterium]